MRNIKLIIEYDGKEYNGWQKQKNKLNIQGEIEKAIETITGEEIELIASGRTDAGVHSLGQTANFKTESTIQIEKIPIAINSQLKKSVRIKSAEEVEENFHSRYNCKRKTYRYTINNSEQGSAIYRNLEYHMPQKLNFEEMKKAIKYFEGEHDFKAFKSSGGSGKTTIRTIYKAEIKRENERIIIELTGNGFLYNMVRILTGTLVAAGTGAMTTADVMQVLEQKDRKLAGPTAPAQGLFLQQVKYD